MVKMRPTHNLTQKELDEEKSTEILFEDSDEEGNNEEGGEETESETASSESTESEAEVEGSDQDHEEGDSDEGAEEETHHGSSVGPISDEASLSASEPGELIFFTSS